MYTFSICNLQFSSSSIISPRYLQLLTFSIDCPFTTRLLFETEFWNYLSLWCMCAVCNGTYYVWSSKISSEHFDFFWNDGISSCFKFEFKTFMEIMTFCNIKSHRPWADGVLMHPPHYLHSLVFSFTPGSVDLEKAC